MRNYKCSMIFFGILFLLGGETVNGSVFAQEQSGYNSLLDKGNLTTKPIYTVNGWDGVSPVVFDDEILQSHCLPVLDCASLGYTMSVADCQGKVTAKCPTGDEVFCKGEIRHPELPILYGDGTVSMKIISGKTPIGIVFDEINKLAIALTDVDGKGKPNIVSINWSDQECNTPDLELCDNITEGTNIDSSVENCEPDGRQNTTAILSSPCDGLTVSAAMACDKYQPTGCRQVFCMKTKWFLPSMRDLQNMYIKRKSIDATLKLLSNLGATTIGSKWYWSSNEASSQYEANHVWHYLMYSGKREKSYKGAYSFSYVRPVVHYGGA